MGSLPPSGSRTFELVVRAGAVLAVFATLVSAGCSGRSERPQSGTSDAGTSNAGQAGESSGGSSSSGGTTGGSSATGQACDITDVESCSSDQDQCCPGPSGATCVPITWRSCTGCDEPCDVLASDSCVDRMCLCGDEPACSGSAPYCVEGTCVECIGDAECAGREGRTQCIYGACLECDPVERTGCPPELACSGEGECVQCNEELPCSGFLHCDPESGYCKACLDHSDCTDPYKPICYPFTEVRSECWDCETDKECGDRDPERGQCLWSGMCAECDDPNDEGCGADAECIYDDEVGRRCVGCESDEDCDDPLTPLCDTEIHTCLPCNDASISAPDDRCWVKGTAGVVCVTSGEWEGACHNCDPVTHAGCRPGRPYCDTELQCQECLDPADCPDGFECSPYHDCVGCVTDADCENNPSGGQCVEVTGGKACRQCDPIDHAGCLPPTTCSPDWIYACY